MITETKDLNKCYGCFACANICPKNCIELKQDAEGFFMPEADNSECIECGLCDKVCIIDRDKPDYLPVHTHPACYYGYLKNDGLRKRSASGGIAFALSERYISNGGVVFGVAGKWFGDVHHIMAASVEDMESICGSKNIQSRLGNSYKQAKKELEHGKKVLFTGTPCQIAGLYSYLGKDYDNLLTADLICHGVPSQKVLKAYIALLEEQHGKKIVKFGRDETFQYLPVQYIAWFEDGSYVILMPETSVYRRGFLSNLFQRKSCAECKFSVFPRVADVTLGDVMFKVDKPREKIDANNLGVSLIAINSAKGAAAFEAIKDRIEYGSIDTQRAANANRWLSHGIKCNPLRQRFFDRFGKEGFAACADVIDKSYNDMQASYIREARIYRIKLLFQPHKLIKKIINRLKSSKEEKAV